MMWQGGLCNVPGTAFRALLALPAAPCLTTRATWHAACRTLPHQPARRLPRPNATYLPKTASCISFEHSASQYVHTLVYTIQGAFGCSAPRPPNSIHLPPSTRPHQPRARDLSQRSECAHCVEFERVARRVPACLPA
ncbi:MAG: hypothetical protein J3K34DRAFT_423969 [Monoraphidium minutum]|nr:MAG: hypothetical protein J3K34DRAFT_423969 [Monoraphidium minutum]